MSECWTCDELRVEVERLREALALERELCDLHAGGATRAEREVIELRADRDSLRQDRDAFSENLSTAQRHLAIAVAGEGFYEQFKAAEAKLTEAEERIRSLHEREDDLISGGQELKAEVERLRGVVESGLELTRGWTDVAHHNWRNMARAALAPEVK